MVLALMMVMLLLDGTLLDDDKRLLSLTFVPLESARDGVEPVR